MSSSLESRPVAKCFGRRGDTKLFKNERIGVCVCVCMGQRHKSLHMFRRACFIYWNLWEFQWSIPCIFFYRMSRTRYYANVFLSSFHSSGSMDIVHLMKNPSKVSENMIAVPGVYCLWRKTIIFRQFQKMTYEWNPNYSWYGINTLLQTYPKGGTKKKQRRTENRDTPLVETIYHGVLGMDIVQAQ